MEKTKSLNYIKQSGIDIVLADGKKHKLIFDLNALEYLQQEFGSIKNLDSIELDNATNIKKLIRAGILHEYEEGREPTLRDVGKLVDIDMIVHFEKYITAALAMSMPESDTEDSEGSEKK